MIDTLHICAAADNPAELRRVLAQMGEDPDQFELQQITFPQL